VGRVDLLVSVRDSQRRMYMLCRCIGEFASDTIMADMKVVRETLDEVEKELMGKVCEKECKMGCDDDQ
jgi:predicted secreted protein